MKDKLMLCFYDGMNLTDAIKLLESSYNKKLSKRTIESAIADIKKYNGTEWR